MGIRGNNAWGNPNDEDMIAAGESVRISSKRGREIIDEIRGVVDET